MHRLCRGPGLCSTGIHCPQRSACIGMRQNIGRHGVLRVVPGHDLTTATEDGMSNEFWVLFRVLACQASRYEVDKSERIVFSWIGSKSKVSCPRYRPSRGRKRRSRRCGRIFVPCSKQRRRTGGLAGHGQCLMRSLQAVKWVRPAQNAQVRQAVPASIGCGGRGSSCAGPPHRQYEPPSIRDTPPDGRLAPQLPRFHTWLRSRDVLLHEPRLSPSVLVARRYCRCAHRRPASLEGTKSCWAGVGHWLFESAWLAASVAT